MKRLAFVFVALNAIDIGLTLKVVGGGAGTELNPLMARILAWPLPAILAYKIALPALFGLLLVLMARLPALRRFNFAAVLGVLVVLEAAVCLFNVGGMILA